MALQHCDAILYTSTTVPQSFSLIISSIRKRIPRPTMRPTHCAICQGEAFGGNGVGCHFGDRSHGIIEFTRGGHYSSYPRSLATFNGLSRVRAPWQQR